MKGLGVFAGAILLLVMAASKVEGQCEMDVMFVLDSSGSMNKIQAPIKNWALAIEYVKAQLTSWKISLTDVRIGGVVFGNNGQLKMKLTESKSKIDAIDKVCKLPFKDQRTNLPGGLRVTREQAFLAANGGRNGVRKVVIVITDGEKSTTKTNNDPTLTVLLEGPLLKNSGATVFFITLDYHYVNGKTARSDHEPIASSPNHFLEYSDFSTLTTDAVNKVNNLLYTDTSCLDNYNPFAGYAGNTCDYVNTPCFPNPCDNGGSCTAIDDVNYVCDCPAGDTCEPDPCNANPCQNGGTCTKTDATNYECECKTGFTGSDCEIEINPCDPGPCQNGGSCTKIDTSTYKCDCLTGYSGDRCEIGANPCSPSPCQNGGVCIKTGVTTYYCDCPSGYDGDDCEIDTDPCTPNQCINSGTCLKIDNSNYRCDCPAGYSGDRCQIGANPCSPSPCQNGGSCTKTSVTTYDCNCLAGYGGDNCEIDTDPCTPNQCINSGTCRKIDNSNYRCDCLAGYSGDRCQIGANPCSPSPCQNGGSCTKTSVTTYDCNCLTGYDGGNCEIDTDPCTPNLCINGGTCQKIDNSNYKCDCKAGFDGDRCENAINPCTSSPCKNGATCTKTGTTSYQCNCKSGWYGSTCNLACNCVNSAPCDKVTGVCPTTTTTTTTTTTKEAGFNNPVESVEPSYGPQAGGTLVTLSGNDFDDLGPDPKVKAGPSDCTIVSRNDTDIVCRTDPLDDSDSSELNKPQPITITNPEGTVNTGQTFTYKKDPEITKVYPLVSTVAGGIILNVTGKNLDSVAHPYKTVDAYCKPDDAMMKTYKSDCEVKSGTEMHCPTPPIPQSLLQTCKNVTFPTRRKRATADDNGLLLNDLHDVNFLLGFLLDGLATYDNMSVALPPYSNLDLYVNPYIPRRDKPYEYKPFWPYKDDLIIINGSNLYLGPTSNDLYKVKVDDEDCTDVKVYDDYITCKPPQKKPKGSKGDPEVVVHLGHLHFDVEDIKYKKIMETHAGIFGVIGAFLFLFLLALLILCICLCCCGAARNREEEEEEERPPKYAGAFIPVERPIYEYKKEIEPIYVTNIYHGDTMGSEPGYGPGYSTKPGPFVFPMKPSDRAPLRGSHISTDYVEEGYVTRGPYQARSMQIQIRDY